MSHITSSSVVNTPVPVGATPGSGAGAREDQGPPESCVTGFHDDRHSGMKDAGK